MRIFKTKLFSKWAKPQNIHDDSLKKAVAELCKGNADADLGDMFTKQEWQEKGRAKVAVIELLLPGL